MRHNIADKTGVRVMAKMCDTCIFRPGNLMHLKKGRVESMVKECRNNDSVIPCHKTFGDNKQAVCRGFFSYHARCNLAVAACDLHGCNRGLRRPLSDVS